MRKLNQRERAMAIVTGVTFTIAALYVYVLEPVWFTFEEKYERAIEREVELAELVNLTERQSEIEEAYEQLRGSLTSDQSGNQQPALELQSDVAALVAGAGLTLGSISPLNAVQGSDFDRFGVQFEVRGDNHEFVRLLQGLQDKGEIHCDSINLTARAGIDPVTATLRVSRLTQKDR